MNVHGLRALLCRLPLLLFAYNCVNLLETVLLHVIGLHG